MAEHLALVLDAPLTAFGGEIIDNYGVIRDFPGRSALIGLLGNALGFDRAEGERLDALQSRLAAGALQLREGVALRDFQTAQLDKGDMGWTTRGRREEREGGPDTYKAPHIRHRDWEADAAFLVALRLDPTGEAPTLETVAGALTRPERPLFLGRKPALPSGPILDGRVEAAGVAAALSAALSLDRAQALLSQVGARGGTRGATGFRAEWPDGEGEGGRVAEVADERRWTAGVHGGLRRVRRGRLPAEAGASADRCIWRASPSIRWRCACSPTPRA